MECWVVLEAEHVFAKQDRLLIAKYLKWMLAHRMNTEWLFCCLVPVAYAHRQRSVALRAKTKQTDLYGRSTTKQPYARSSPSPPRPLSPSQSPGGEGGPSGL
jgi:hypothetical protein